MNYCLKGVLLQTQTLYVFKVQNLEGENRLKMEPP